MIPELQPKAAVTSYQLACLKRENDFLVAKSYEGGGAVADPAMPTLREWLGAVVTKHSRTPPLLYLMEFYWTIGRLTGLRPQQNEVPEIARATGAMEAGTSPGGPCDPYPVDTTLLPITGAAVPQASPRLLIDVSDTAYSAYKTGIQRYVREVARAAFESGQGATYHHAGRKTL